MKCKYCEAELEEGVSLCPACGKDNAEETVTEQPVEETAEEKVEESKQEDAEKEESKQEEAEKEEIKETYKVTPGKLAAAIGICVVVLAVLIALMISGTTGSTEPTLGTDPVGDIGLGDGMVPVYTLPADTGADDVTFKGTYMASDEEVLAARDTVVAKIGDAELTNAMLQIYYWSQVRNFVDNYGMYASLYGIDLTQPLDVQPCMAYEGWTWHQYFLYAALSEWQMYQSMVNLAEDANFQISETYRDYIDGLPAELEATAAAAGFESLDAMIKDEFGQTAVLDDFMGYTDNYYVGYLYYNDMVAKLAPTEAEIRAYYEQHAGEFAAAGITEETLLVDVRHILIAPQGGTVDETGATVYSEQEWGDAEKEANEILDLWLKNDPTESSFGQLANEHTDDPGSSMFGGLYTDVAEGEMVTEFNDWCFDPARQVGDYGIVKTVYGYHIMYFSGSRPMWIGEAESGLLNQMSNQLVDDALAANELEVYYDKILLGQVTISVSYG